MMTLFSIRVPWGKRLAFLLPGVHSHVVAHTTPAPGRMVTSASGVLVANQHEFLFH
jgi:hypothetical protein